MASILGTSTASGFGYIPISFVLPPESYSSCYISLPLKFSLFGQSRFWAVQACNKTPAAFFVHFYFIPAPLRNS